MLGLLIISGQQIPGSHPRIIFTFSNNRIVGPHFSISSLVFRYADWRSTRNCMRSGKGTAKG